MACTTLTPGFGNFTVNAIFAVNNPTLVAQLQAQFPAGINGFSPRSVAAAYGITFNDSGVVTAVAASSPFANTVTAFGGVYIFFDFYGVATPGELNADGTPGGQAFDPTWFTVGSFLALANANNGAGKQPCGKFTWHVSFLQSSGGPTAGPPPATVPLLGQRVWIDGFEIFGLGEGATSQFNAITRDASRTPDGFGLAYRGWFNTRRTHARTPNARATWERVYIRPRKFPTGGDDCFWSCNDTLEGGAAVLATISPGGVISFYNKGTTAYPGTLVGTAVVPLNKWSRLDIRLFFRFTLSSGSSRLAVYVNGVAAFGPISVGTGGFGLDTFNALHASSAIGMDANQPVSFGAELDFDDWVAANELPGQVPGHDLASGSHVQLVRPTAAAIGGAWTGDWRYLLDNPQYNAAVVVTTATPSSLLSIASDLQDLQYGIAAIAQAVFLVADPGAQITLGGSIIVTGGSPNTWFTTLISVADSTAINAIPPRAPYTMALTSANNAGTFSIRGLLAAAEIIGRFGAEDNDPAITPAAVYPFFTGIHNAPYPSLAGGLNVANPTGVVAIVGGLYTGNSLALDLPHGATPPHWLWVRSVTPGPTEGVCWWSSMEAAHPWKEIGFVADYQPQASMGSNFAPLNPVAAVTRTAGLSPRNNLNAAVYQYIVFSDNAMRFLLNGAFSHLPGLASAVNTLINPTFIPDGVQLMQEDTGSGATGHYFKGVGHLTDTASPLDGAAVAGIASLAAGAITSKTTIHGNAPQTAFAAWRKADGLGGSGAVDLITWVGDGTGPRTLAVAIGGNRPLWALATPHNGVSITRDPSHTTNTSTRIGVGAVINDGIVGGGINQVLVDASLNANGVVYDMIVLAGNTTACNAGWACNNPQPGGPGTPPAPWFPTPPIPVPLPPFIPPPGPPAPPPIGPGCISMAQAVTELATRLGDLTNVHWTSAELFLYLIEALRVFNSLTHYYKGRTTFQTVAGQAFYELPTVIPTLRAYNVLDTDLLTLTEYALLEPPTPTAWTGTAMFTLDALVQVLQRRLDSFRFDTGLVVTNLPPTLALTPDFNGRVDLDPSIITLRRVAWNYGGGVPGPNTTPLLREDTWGMNQFAQNWPSLAPASPVSPWAYSVGETPPLVLQLAPPPTVAGQLDLLAIVRAATVAPATAASILQIPDDFCWVIRYGMLADLLKAPGPANDPVRAALCDTLYDQGVLAAKRFGVVIDARINGLVTTINAVSDADNYRRQWQVGTAPPTQVLLAGINLVACSPVPNGAYTINLDVVCNIRIPGSIFECYFEGGAALTQVLLDYAQFCAVFKEGASQAQEATQLLQRFLTACGVVINLDQAATPTRDAVIGQSKQSERVEPREQPAVDTSTGMPS